MIYPIFVLVFVTLVNTEWVEITQQHHRKPDNNHDSIKYTTNPDGDNNGELDKVNLESGTRETLFKSKQASDPKRPIKGNRIYIKHEDNADRLTPSYPTDGFSKHNVELNKNPDITRNGNDENINTKENVMSHAEKHQIEANKKGNRVFITQNSNKQNPRESLEHIDDTKERKNNLKKLHNQQHIHNTEQSLNYKAKDSNDNEIKSTTERISVVTSKKGNRVYFLYNDNRPSLVKNIILRAKNDSDITNTPTQAATRNNQLEENHEVITNSTEKSISHYSIAKQYQKQRIQSNNSDIDRSTATTQIIDTTKTNKNITEERDIMKGTIIETKNKSESKTNIPESEVETTSKNNHKINTNTRNYFTTEAVRVLTSKKGNKIYFIYKDMNIDEPTLENYENITEVAFPLTAIDGSLELETVENTDKDMLHSNTKKQTNKQTSETIKAETTKINNKNKSNEMNINEKTDNTSTLNAKNNETSKLIIQDKGESKMKNDTSKEKWIKGHVYRVPNLAHVSKLNKNDPELLNITHMNHDNQDPNEDTIIDANSEDNIFIIEHPTAIVDKTKLDSYDDLPIRNKVSLLSDGESTPEFVTNQDQDFEDRFEEIYIVDGDDKISKLLEEEIKRTEDGNFRLQSDEEPYIDRIKSPPAENKDEGETNHKRNPIEYIIKFMKVIADNIAKNTHTSFESKIRYLKELKESIMRSIEERIDAAWPDDVPRSRREARGHHIEFPSSESALMSISFLTFAVYLIKLVLYVIQAYKNKTAMFPAVVAVSRAAELANKLINND